MQAAETAGLLNLVPSVSVLTLFSTARGNEVEASGFSKSARLRSYYIYWLHYWNRTLANCTLSRGVNAGKNTTFSRFYVVNTATDVFHDCLGLSACWLTAVTDKFYLWNNYMRRTKSDQWLSLDIPNRKCMKANKRLLKVSRSNHKSS